MAQPFRNILPKNCNPYRGVTPTVGLLPSPCRKTRWCHGQLCSVCCGAKLGFGFLEMHMVQTSALEPCHNPGDGVKFTKNQSHRKVYSGTTNSRRSKPKHRHFSCLMSHCNRTCGNIVVPRRCRELDFIPQSLPMADDQLRSYCVSCHSVSRVFLSTSTTRSPVR